MKEITLFGAGGHCTAVIELIRSTGLYNPIVIYDHDPKQSMILDVPVRKYEVDDLNGPVCVSIGDNFNRNVIVQSIRADFPAFIHSSVVKYPSVKIGDGTLVLPNSVLDAAAAIGSHCIINNNATVSHDTVLGDFTHIAIQAAIAGGVRIGEGSLIGAGSVILPEITIGKWVVVGAGSVVTKDVPDYAVVYGNPAKIVRFNTPAE